MKTLFVHRSDVYKRNRGLVHSSPPSWLHSLGWALFALAMTVLLGLAILTLRVGWDWVRP